MARSTPPGRRDAILSAARETFAARGYAAARMDDIAGRVGISKAALYLQFESKEAIFRALSEALIEETLPQLLPEDFGDTPAPELLRGMIIVAMDRITSGDIAFLPRLIIGEGGNFPELARFYLDHGLNRILDAIENVIRHGIARGEFVCADPHLATRTVVGGVILSNIWKIIFEPVGGTPLDVAAMAQSHVDVLLNGLKAREKAT